MFHSWLEILDKSPSSVLWLSRVPPEAGSIIILLCICLVLYMVYVESNILAETERTNSRLKSRILFTNKLAREEVRT